MKLLTRNLLYIFCILNLLQFSLNANASDTLEISDISEESITLDKDYVEFTTTSKQNLIDVSILKSFNDLADYLKEKSFNLLHWSQKRANTPAEVEKYQRNTHFGPWVNDPNDDTCYNTRAMVLNRDSSRKVRFKDHNKCVVESGLWHDPYTNENYREALDIQVDHFVPLKNAYISGAHRWSFRARCLYANYLGNNFHLLSVEGRQNMKKGDRPPSQYLPPNTEYSCTYIKNWLKTKFIWGLRMSLDEANAIVNVIKENGCNLSQFYMDSREIAQQYQFTKDNMDLCELVIKRRAKQ